jgi:RNA polymerase sigma factor (sigma-70 family)
MIFLGAAVDSDKEILDKIKKGQSILAEIVSELARIYGHDLLRFCETILATYPRQRLEEVVQEVFIAVYLSLQRYDINRGLEGIKPWVWGIAQKKCFEELRRNDQLKIVTSDSTELERSNPSALENVSRLNQKILAKRAFVELSAQERLMIATDLMDWFSRKEMASMFGYDNPESYDRQMHRIRQKMMEFVQGERHGASRQGK